MTACLGLTRLSALLASIGCLFFQSPPAAEAQRTPEAGSLEQCQSLLSDWKQAPLADGAPFAVMLQHTYLAWDCTVVAFYAVNLPSRANPDAEPIYLARRWYGSTLNRNGSTTFADSRTCPDLRWAMWRLSRFDLPDIDVPGLAPRSSVMGITVDGAYFHFWTNRLQNGVDKLDTTELSFGASNNDALAALSKQVLGSLVRCWSESEPVL